MSELIEAAKAERATFERLAIDARKQHLQSLVDVYCRSIIRLNAVIRLTEMSEQANTVCERHNRFKPCLDCFKQKGTNE